MRKTKLWGALAVLTLGLQSCSLDSLADGTEENYEIKDKNAGTLVVDEELDWAAYYEIGDNPYDVEAIQFFPDGTCQFIYEDPDYGFNDVKSSESTTGIEVDVNGSKVRVPLRVAGSPDVGSVNEELMCKSFTRDSKGRFVITDYGWTVDGNTLYEQKNGKTETYTAQKASEEKLSSLSARLCHTWELENVLVKFYKTGTDKLVFTYHLNKKELEKDCVKTLRFASSYQFFRHDSKGRIAGHGMWHWTDESNQKLFYKFQGWEYDEELGGIVYYIGENYLTAYFASNHLYITEENQRLDTDDDEAGKLDARCLYQLKAVDIKR